MSIGSNDHTVRILLIFVTGGCVLALELISSRVMTSFFGVSLYIWTSILSVTLLFLAIGYMVGGNGGEPPVRQKRGFLIFLSPAVSGLAVVATALLYPVMFRPLAQWSLLGGSYVACLILLAVPLVFLSSLNPILIAYLNRKPEERAKRQKDRSGTSRDGGSGLVLFLSTIGSVAGVVVAALIVIPNFMNFHGLLLIAATLCVLASVTTCVASDIARRQRWAIFCVSGFGTVAAGFVALYLYPGSVGRQVELTGHDWRIVANQPSIFGAFTVVQEEEGTAGSAHGSRILIQNGLMQNGVDGNGEPYFLFTRALEVLGLGAVPDAESALVLGLAAGLLPMRLNEKRVDTDIVEIEPRVTEIAETFFDFDRSKFDLFFEDARTFVSACPRKYDLVFVDLFHGDGMPEHLVTKEFFLDVRSCLTKRGALVMNSFFDAAYFEPQRSLMATIVDVFEHVAFFQEGVAQGMTASNGFLLSLKNGPVNDLDALRLDTTAIPAKLREAFDVATESAVQYSRRMPYFRKSPIISDSMNLWSSISIEFQENYRKRKIDNIPVQLLVN